LTAHKDFLEKQQDTIKRIFERAGSSVSSCEDKINLTKRDAQLDRFFGEENIKQKKFRHQVMQNFDEMETLWRKEKETLGYLISYYHPKNKDVSVSWKNVKDSVTNYFVCSEQWYKNNRVSDETESACKTEKDSVTNSILSFTTNLERSRNYAWEGWEDPNILRNTLENRSNNDKASNINK
jgi:hypothetical protein